MRPRVTITIAKDLLVYVDRTAGKKGVSRSQVIESLLRDSHRRRREEELASRAKEFFAQPESVEEIEERQDWLKMSAETQRVDR
jgi:metal-responsive CopG/Arc/MetJ family transcriptional regulator